MFGIKSDSKKGKDYIKSKYGVDVKDVPQDNFQGELLFCIYDSVVGEYNPPFVSKNIQTAVRNLKDSLKGKQTIINMHPEDYHLRLIASFDKETGFVNNMVSDWIEGVNTYSVLRLFNEVNKVDIPEFIKKESEDINEQVQN